MEANPQDHELIAVPIDSFRGAAREIHFDIFLRLSENNFAHVFSRQSGLDYKRLAGYFQKGVQSLYIRGVDEPLYREFISRSARTIFEDPASSPEKKTAMLLNMTEQNLAEIFSQHVLSDDTAKRTQQLIRSYVDVMTSSPHTLTLLVKLVSHGEYLYFHSIAVAIFSMLLAKATGQFNQSLLEIVGMGGFLHDIGCTQIRREILDSPHELSDAEWGEMKNHPKLGLNMLANCSSIPDEVRYIVYQHHEEPGGAGYPNSLSGNAIYYPARVVAVADAFSALISRRPFRHAYTVEQAFQIMNDDAEHGKYDRDLLKVMFSVFGRQGANGKKAA